MDNWFNRIWAPVATFIGTILLVNQLAEAFRGNRTLVTGLLIIGALMFISAGISKFAFAKSSIPGIPQYKFHWFAKIAIIPIFVFALFSAYYVLVILVVAPDCCGFIPTTTSTTTGTPTPTPTFTSTPDPTPTRKEHGTYYMIVLDASLKMQESFDGKTKWDAALEAINAILRSREEEANYGLVVIGSSESANGADPCTQPSSLTLPFSSRKSVIDHINQLQLSGGGSIFEAFNLAKDQFRTLPENTTRTLIFITGSSDACDSGNEWKDLERAFNFPGGIGVEQYSEIIVLEQNQLISRKIEDQFTSLSVDLNVQSPTNFVILNQSNNSVVNSVITNVSNYVEITNSSFTIHIPVPISTIAPSNTPDTANMNNLSITNVVPLFTPTFTQAWSPTITLTSTPTLSPLPPTYTNTPIPWVRISSDGRYGVLMTSGSGPHCQVFEIQNNSLKFTTWAKPPSDNDVKNCDFGSNNTQFAAAYHYSDNGDYTWIGVWSIQTGAYLGCFETFGWITDLSGAFNGQPSDPVCTPL